MLGIPIYEYNEERVITFTQLGEYFNWNRKSISNAFANNKIMFKENIDYYFLNDSEQIAEFNSSNDITDKYIVKNMIYILTRTGLAKLVAIIDNSIIWDKYFDLEVAYFTNWRNREMYLINIINTNTIEKDKRDKQLEEYAMEFMTYNN